MPSRVSLQRLLFILVLVLATAGVVTSGAPAGDFTDDCPNDGSDVYVCPSGSVGVPYSHTFKLKGDEDLGCARFTVSSGNFPPGLTLGSKGEVSGTPTQPGSFTFYITVEYPGCKNSSDRRFRIVINPGSPVPPPLPRLIIGPESVSGATVGSPYMAAMTANLSDPKTWSISAGILPPGLNLGTSDGLISGTPTAVGAYAFTVHARIDATRTATKSFALNVREALTIAGPTDPALEVGIRYLTALKGYGGLPTYKWALTAGELPPGLTFFPGGAITGRPTTAGEFEFTVTLIDSEGRTTTYDGSLTVAARLAVATTRLTGRTGRLFRKNVITVGGIDPTSMRLKKGPLPGGVRFDRATASFVGIPKKAGTWIVLVEVVDALKVKAKATIVLVIRA